MIEKNYVLDTSVYLTDSESIFKFDNHNIFIPLKVLEEIDKHKKRQDSVGLNARRIIRILDEMREKGSLHDGVKIGENKGFLKVMSYGCLQDALFPPDLDIRIPDHTIIATAKAVQTQNPNTQMIVVSRDINMRVICDSVGIDAEDYICEKAVPSSDELYKGFSTHLVDDQVIDRFYEGEDILIRNDETEETWYPNQYVMMISNANQKKSALARFGGHHVPLKKVVHDKICAIAAGLQQTIGLRENHYSRLIVSRPVQPLGKDIGYLPGTMQEKMLPWLMPIQDNLQFLMGNDKSALQIYLDKGKIEIEALTYIRGRSISDAYIIIDEAQNLTMHEVKTIITRIGEGTKIVLTGDIEQIDNIYVNEISNGLAHAVEKFKEFYLSGHVTFKKGERSETATLASKIL
jgi:PhoH-like ATPase